jgi:excisionase family DNA binding protein
MKQIPALPELMHGLESAFRYHLEVETKGKKGALLRMAGREFRVLDVEEPPDVLVNHLCENLSEVAAYGVATVLTDDSPAGTRLRMDLIAALAHIESTKGPGKEKHAPDGEPLLTTAEAAHQLGMSRPYISMLCNQGKLGEVHRSEGGHRRIRQSAVDKYKTAHSNGAANSSS